MKRKPYNRKFHHFTFSFCKILCYPIVKLIWKYKCVSKYKIAKNEKVLVLSNHQTDLDAILMCYSFNKPIYFLTTDTFFSKTRTAKFLINIIGLIPKKKGTVDTHANIEMMRCIKDGGSIGIFPEGNRTYAEFQYPIQDGLAKLVKLLGVTLVLYNLHGGTGSYPRFAKKRRKGKFYGEIKKVLHYNEYKDIPDNELTQIIKENLVVYDSESDLKFKSSRKAEYLEREFFVCPICGKMQTLYSNKNHFKCSNCHLDVIIDEHMHFSSLDPEFKFRTLNDWYQYQKSYLKTLDFKDEEPIFIENEQIKLFISNPFQNRKMLYKGDKMILYKDKIIFGDDKVVINVSDITFASPVSGKDLSFSTNEQNYLIKGKLRFNPLKYALIFNKLETQMKINKSDIYYTLD